MSNIDENLKLGVSHFNRKHVTRHKFSAVRRERSELKIFTVSTSFIRHLSTKLTPKGVNGAGE